MCLWENGQMEQRMVKEGMNMQMEIIMKVSFRMEGDKEEELIFGRMDKNMLDYGKMIEWKEKQNRQLQSNKISFKMNT